MIAARGDDRLARPGRPYLVLGGETAVGKSDVAIEIAERLACEIVVADSRQVYRALDIGTAKPTVEERTRVTHHLLDLVDVGERYTAADFARDARCAIADIQTRGQEAVVCGGTGFYLAALAGALDPLPPVSPEAVARMAKFSAGDRHARLADVDPVTAARLHPHDLQRIDRALAFWLETGEPLSRWQRGGETPLPHVAVRLERPRAEVRSRIETRLDRMLASGLEEEARRFWEAGYTPADPGLDTIGYQEWWPYFEGRIDRAEVRERILTASRRYAKRQVTWFRHQGGYRPVAAEAGAERVLAAWREGLAALAAPAELRSAR